MVPHASLCNLLNLYTHTRVLYSIVKTMSQCSCPYNQSVIFWVINIDNFQDVFCKPFAVNANTQFYIWLALATSLFRPYKYLFTTISALLYMDIFEPSFCRLHVFIGWLAAF